MFTSLLLLLSFGAHALELKFLDSVHWPAVVDFQGSKVGGLSGLTRLASGDYAAICDDRSAQGPSRAYVLKIQLNAKTQRLEVGVQKEVVLKDASGMNYAQGALDAESIVVLPDGNWMIGAEGDNNSNPRIPPSVFSVSPEGKWLKSIPVPAKFIPESSGAQSRGIVNNGAFESTTLAPNQSDLFVVAESSLTQDGPLSTFTQGSFVRLIHWKKDGDEFRPQGEFAYPLSPIPKIIEGADAKGDVGVSEALALDADTLLMLERSYVSNSTRGLNKVRLFSAEKTKAQDISTKESIRGVQVRTMNKNLILDFDDILPLLPEKNRRIDNLEGMAWGPMLKNGHRTLIFISDSNFNPSQETQFLIFEVLGIP